MLETLVSGRAAGTGRGGPQSGADPSQLWFAVKGCRYVRPRREAESKKAPLEGVWGG